jgi:transcriptional regulator with XRE-family HTH domain
MGILLREIRNAVGVSQQDLSLQLRRGPKYIWRIENAYTEIDLFEFVEIAEALGQNPPDLLHELIRRIG